MCFCWVVVGGGGDGGIVGVLVGLSSPPSGVSTLLESLFSDGLTGQNASKQEEEEEEEDKVSCILLFRSNETKEEIAYHSH